MKRERLKDKKILRIKFLTKKAKKGEAVFLKDALPLILESVWVYSRVDLMNNFYNCLSSENKLVAKKFFFEFQPHVYNPKNGNESSCFGKRKNKNHTKTRLEAMERFFTLDKNNKVNPLKGYYGGDYLLWEKHSIKPNIPADNLNPINTNSKIQISKNNTSEQNNAIVKQTPFTSKPRVIQDIINALNLELKATPDYYDFKIVNTSREQDLYKITLDLSSVYTPNGYANVLLDDGFEEAKAWWADPIKGTGQVLSVIPEDDQIIIRFATTTPPNKAGRIRLYSPRYLDSLVTIWKDDFWSKKAIDIFKQGLQTSEPILSGDEGFIPKYSSWLRKKQLDLFNLIKYTDSFLWGLQEQVRPQLLVCS